MSSKLRLNLEPAAAALAAERHSQEDRERIASRHRAFIEARAQHTLARQEDFEFHHAIALATHNPFFAVLFEQLNLSAIPRSKLISSEVNTATADVYLKRVEVEHQAVVDAIFARDPEQARAAMQQHLTRARQTYQQFQVSE